MSTFSWNFQAGSGWYGDPFPPIINTIIDFGWSLLPAFPGYVIPSPGGGHVPGLPPPPVVTHPQIPVVNGNEGWVIEGSPAGVYPVLPGPVGTGGGYVPPQTVIVGEVSTEVERHPEGDFPAGSIFAPGQTWGGASAHDFDDVIYEGGDVAIDWGGILDWSLDTIAGEQPWQAFGKPATGYATTMGFAAPTIQSGTGPTQIPTGIPAYTGAKVATNGDCGNRRYVTLDRETGKISCKRRRRRRLLTNRDLADLASLKTITGGGAALNAAVIRAVR